MNARDIVGVLLCGGQSRRMGGGDKSLRQLAGRSLIGHVVARLRPQVGPLVLNANGDPARFAHLQLPVVQDVVAGHAGPLAGVLSGMTWAAEAAPDCAWVATVATDAPFIPHDLILRLTEAVTAEGADMACAASGGRAHPVFALWPVRLAAALRRALVAEGIRKVDQWTARYRLTSVSFSTDPVDPFFNINRPEDLAEAETILRLSSGRPQGR
jgi:molybdopterin-guanine dinucleotide biosynthesis protein A